MTYDVDKECSLAYSSPDGAMCNGFLGTHSCPAGYFLKYVPNTCPVNPPYKNGPTNQDYDEARAKLKKPL